MTVKRAEGCCPPVTAAVLAESDADDLAESFKALADPVRLRLLSLVASATGGEACACDLVAPSNRTQPTVSHHLAQLVDAGLLHRDKRGKWVWYRVNTDRLAALQAALAPQ